MTRILWNPVPLSHLSQAVLVVATFGVLRVALRAPILSPKHKRVSLFLGIT